MMLDCAIIGGGPAGLNAALVLGRARKNVILFDDNKPRNAVTQESHGFITRDGVKPSEFRAIAHQDIRKYPSVEIRNSRIISVSKEDESSFRLETDQGGTFQAKKVILAAGLQEILPAVDGIHEFYGKSLFSCPYCDGWELRDKPLVVICETEHVHHMAKFVSNWSRDLLICTNGNSLITAEQQDMLRTRNIQVVENKITALLGTNGQLENILFDNGEAIEREGGFATSRLIQASSLGESLGCTMNAAGGIVTDAFGRTNIPGVYAAGDTAVIASTQLIIAAAEGSRAAMGVTSDLVLEEF